MDAIKKISDLDSSDRSVVERVFGQPLDASTEVVLILRTNNEPTTIAPQADDESVPAWCNVLEGLSDDELFDFNAALEMPVHLAHPAD